MDYIRWIYISYFFILGILILVQAVKDQNGTYTNYGTAVVTTLHLILGTLELSGIRIHINNTATIIQTTLQRYRNTAYNVVADFLIMVALILSIFALVYYKNNQPLWLAFTPISIAFIANIGCLKGRMKKEKQDESAYALMDEQRITGFI